MAFKKVTLSLPANLYAYGMEMVEKGMFSNFSDLVRSGVRNELRDLQELSEDFDERVIYSDKKLIAAVKRSKKQIQQGKGNVLRTPQELRAYAKKL